MATVLDASNYLRGLLVLIRRDGKISEQESELVLHVGKSLGFEEGFCKNAIKEILENSYIDDSPPTFSSKEVAMKFIKDGLVAAHSDNEMHEFEEGWLRSTAEKNGCELQWFLRLRDSVINSKGRYGHLEADGIVVTLFGNNKARKTQ